MTVEQGLSVMGVLVALLISARLIWSPADALHEAVS